MELKEENTLTNLKQGRMDKMNRTTFRLFILPLLLVFCTLFYYFGELVEWAAWDALRSNFFYGIHDVHRLLFLMPIAYADDSMQPTEKYRFNPNGSPSGLNALCSQDGRHLAMMPHPERSFLLWQWPFVPEGWKTGKWVAPWLKLFQNARAWCENNRQM